MRRFFSILICALMITTLLSGVTVFAGTEIGNESAASSITKTDENDVKATVSVALESEEGDVSAPVQFDVKTGSAINDEAIAEGWGTGTVSQKCGDNLSWIIENNVLTISGAGDMYDYDDGDAPWYSQRASIKEIVIEDGVTSIGDCCFYNLYKLEKIDISDTVTEIRGSAFYKCKALTSVAIPNSVKVLEEGCFAACTSLASVTANGLTTLENYVFNDTALTTYKIPASLTSIGYLTFMGTPIESYAIENGNSAFKVIDGVVYTYDEKTLLLYPSGNAATSFVVPTGVTKISAGAFLTNINLVSVNIPETVIELGESAFQDCKSLKSVAIPDSVTTVGDFTFAKCPALEKVTFGTGLKETVYMMFEECTALKDIDFGTGLEIIYARTFGYCNSIEKVHLPANIKEVNNGCFGECTNLKSVSAEGLVHIAYQAFFNCKSLTEVNLNEGLEYIYNLAFYGCSSLKEMKIPSTIKLIETEAIPEGVKLIDLNPNLSPFGVNGYRLVEQAILDVYQDYGMAYEVLDLVNKERKKAGLNPLVMNNELLDAAMVRSSECAILFSHTRPDGTLCFTASNLMNGENIAAGQLDAETVMESWMNSAGHKANILTDAYTTIGIGCIRHNDTYYWAQCFGKGEDTVSCTKPSNKKIAQTISFAHSFETNEGQSVEIVPQIYIHPNSVSIGESMEAYVAVDNPTLWTRAIFSNSGITWSSSDNSIFTVNSSGKITGKSVGKATLKAKMKISALEKEIKVFSDEVTRIYGADRYETALKTADVLKNELQVDKFDTIIVASGNTFADALPGSYLAAKKNAPILLINEKKATDVISYIEKNLNNNGKIYVLGGEAAIPSEWLANLNYTRLGGSDRYETNLMILKEAGVDSTAEVMVCTGKNFADSLSVSATGKPVLLVGKALTENQKIFLNNITSGTYYIIGGTAAVNSSIEKACAKYGETLRIEGDDRYETSGNVAWTFFEAPTRAVLAYSNNFPDGLSAGPLAYSMEAPLILTKTGKEDMASRVMRSCDIYSGAVLGGPKLISDKSVRTIFQMKSSDTIKIK